MTLMKTPLTLNLNVCADILSAQMLKFLFTSLKVIAALISFVAISCANGNMATSDGIGTAIIGKTSLDGATALVVDIADRRFENFTDANVALVYKDSILIVNNRNPQYGDPLISLYDINRQMRHIADYIPRGSDTDEMVACGIHIAGDKLFVSDSYYTGRYCAIPLKKIPPADQLHLSVSGVEERGVAISPFHDGLLVENPQCYSNDEAGIHNDVPRLLHYRNGRCLTPQETVAYQVAEVNTGADIHYNESCGRICFVSHRQPFVEFYDDSLQLVHSIRLESESLQKIHVESPQTRVHNNLKGDIGRGNVSFERARRVVGAGSQLHSFLCSAANDEHIYLVYCGRLFNYAYHTFPTYILVLDWNGNLVATYRYNRWIQAVSPSTKTDTFYLTVYADDGPDSARMKLVKVTP